ncbi:MAG: hypothetical protein SGBAC_013446 [Bacillariaceae sp.]
MATVAAAPTPTKAKNPDDVRAAAMAVLQMADERTAKGATVAKHRSPLPERASMAKNSNKNIAARASQSSQQSGDRRASFNLLSWGKKTMDDMKEKMSELDEKFLAMQFEQEEKFRKAYDKTTADFSDMLASPAKKNSKATPETPVSPEKNPQSPLASVFSSPKSAPPKSTNNQEGPTAMSRFRSSFAGLTQKLAPQPQPPKKPSSVDEQIVAELEQLHELMTLCHTLLAEKNDLINLIDYEPDPRLPHTIKRLEASLGRMDQLMESGIDGQFQDDTTQICVSTYERLILTLEKCNSPLVKSNAFAFAKDLEGDSEFDEAPQTQAAKASDATAKSEPSDVAKSPAKEAEDTTAVAAAAATITTSPDLTLDGLDADMDIDLAAFEIGSDDEDDILNTTSPSEDEEKKTDADDDFIKDMFDIGVNDDEKEDYSLLAVAREFTVQQAAAVATNTNHQHAPKKNPQHLELSSITCGQLVDLIQIQIFEQKKKNDEKAVYTPINPYNLPDYNPSSSSVISDATIDSKLDILFTQLGEFGYQKRS